MKAYKGFKPDMTCRGFKFEVGKLYEHNGPVEACESGFHSCEYPLDVLRYYPPGTSVFAEVEADGVISRHDEDSKIASSLLTVKKSLGMEELIKAAVEYTTSRCTPIDNSSPAWSEIASGAAMASGTQGAATASGTQGAAMASGYQGAATASGTQGAATASGYQGVATASGHRSVATASGDHSVAMSSGALGTARAEAGCAIVLVCRHEDGSLRHIRASKVGENGIRAGVFYTLGANGDFIEAD